jgi:hypothetical protein
MVVLLKIEGKCAGFRAICAHVSGHLPSGCGAARLGDIVGVWRGLLPGTAILPDASKTLAEAENASF